MEEDKANPDLETRKSHIRPAEDDDELEHVVPNKMRKLADDVSTNLEEEGNENVSDVDLGDEEEEYADTPDPGTEQKDEEVDDEEEQLDLEGDYASDQPGGEFDEELEEGDTFDEDDDELGTTAEEMEDNVQEEEEADSSRETDFVQTNLAYIEDCQSDIDTLNHKANEEILLVELKYNKLRLPVYKRRNTFISRVSHFWATVFSKHRQLKQVLTKDDVKCLKHITKLQVEDFEDNRSGYSIQFYFSENPWFENKVITKEYHLPWQGSPSCSCTPIQWKKGMNLTMKSSSFFSWFTSQEDASADDIAEIIKDDLWPNPLQCFPMSNKQPDDSDDDDDDEADDSGNLNVKDDSIVLLDDTHDDDDVEYISSEDEEEQEWPGEKVRGKTTRYLVQEEEADEDEEFDDDVDVIGSSGQQQQQINVQERRPKTAEVISIDDDYLAYEEEDYESESVDLDGEEKLLQGQAENEEEFEEAESSKEPLESPKIGDRLSGEVEIQHADTSHDSNEESCQSNGIVGSSTNVTDNPEQTDAPIQNELETATAAKSKIQEQSKVVSTSTTADSDITAGGT